MNIVHEPPVGGIQAHSRKEQLSCQYALLWHVIRFLEEEGFEYTNFWNRLLYIEGVCSFSKQELHALRCKYKDGE
jgi:hypothetical protein